MASTVPRMGPVGAGLWVGLPAVDDARVRLVAAPDRDRRRRRNQQAHRRVLADETDETAVAVVEQAPDGVLEAVGGGRIGERIPDPS